MRIGNSDGKGSVYTNTGEPMLSRGEQIVRRIENDNMDVSEGSGFWNMKVLFPYTPEKGTLYLTSSRLLFIRKPNPDKVMRGYSYTTGAPDAVADFYRAYKLYKMGAFEYVEIPYSEIEGFYVKRGRAGDVFLPSRPDLTRKALLTRRSKSDDKLQVLRGFLEPFLPLTLPEDRKGTYCLGDNRPFLHRKA